MEKMPDFWAILFSLYFAPETKIEGIVKFQKILAQLQIEGLPIEWIFIKENKGSFCPKAKENIEECESKDFIAHSKVHIAANISLREDFMLLEKGKEYFENKIYPLLKDKIDEIFFRELIAKLTGMSSTQASDFEHREFLIDEINKFHEKLLNTKKQLIEAFEEYSKHEKIETAGMIQFLYRTLNYIRNFEQKNKFDTKMGKFYIVYLSHRFLKNLAKKDIDRIKRDYFIIKHLANIYYSIDLLKMGFDFKDYFLEEELRNVGCQIPAK